MDVRWLIFSNDNFDRTCACHHQVQIQISWQKVKSLNAILWFYFLTRNLNWTLLCLTCMCVCGCVFVCMFVCMCDWASICMFLCLSLYFLFFWLCVFMCLFWVCFCLFSKCACANEYLFARLCLFLSLLVSDSACLSLFVWLFWFHVIFLSVSHHVYVTESLFICLCVCFVCAFFRLSLFQRACVTDGLFVYLFVFLYVFVCLTMCVCVWLCVFVCFLSLSAIVTMAWLCIVFAQRNVIFSLKLFRNIS